MIKDRKKLAVALILLNLAFIWGNSMRTGNASQETSEGIVDWFNIFLYLDENSAAGLVDETIQLFTPDRGPSLIDVWLDASGALAGTLLLTLGQHLIKKKQNP